MATTATKKINRLTFFARVRKTFFNGKLSQQHVDGMSAILDEWEARQMCDLRFLAYMLATVYHETAKTMFPIEEYGHGKGKQYGKPEANGKIYYGRGFVQLTWGYNYSKFNIYDHPEKALELPTATDILFNGMIKGIFTGRKLSDYFNEKEESEKNHYWVNARRIINGTDMAETIAEYGKQFLSSLS